MHLHSYAITSEMVITSTVCLNWHHAQEGKTVHSYFKESVYDSKDKYHFFLFLIQYHPHPVPPSYEELDPLPSLPCPSTLVLPCPSHIWQSD